MRNLYNGSDLLAELHMLWAEVRRQELATCPDCEREMRLPDGAVIGEIVSCPDCGLELEVKQINGDKVELKEISIEKEDWGE